MNIHDILLIYDYNYWANRQILAAASQLSPDQYLTADSCGDEIRPILVHALEAEWAWRMLCQHQTVEHFKELQPEDFPTVESVITRWQEEELQMRAYLAILTDEDLNGPIRYTTPEGETRERILWHCLFQVTNHATQHRSEAAVILTRYGLSPGDLDFTAFLNAMK